VWLQKQNGVIGNQVKEKQIVVKLLLNTSDNYTIRGSRTVVWAVDMVRGKGDQEQYMLTVIKYSLEAAFLCINGDLSLHS
jgi:hypothetical protein